ncbi:MAG: glycosyl hydrolase family 28-related protein [Kiritimatiellae bacterium]|nr:glycosyl hydrolase family 28-related protein [Kiritimatiellia bacterium]MDD5522774.1 glycosyl hydrolase family 28-related protein [Kiritimatiellia bacterium]
MSKCKYTSITMIVVILLSGAAAPRSLIAKEGCVPGQGVPPACTINIRDFGAVGDGVSDDTAAIQKAIDAAVKNQATVFVPEGVFASSTLKLHSHVGMMGNPSWSFRDFGGSIIRLKDEKANCLLDLTGTHGVTLNGLCLDGAKLGKEIHGVLLNKPKQDFEGSEEDTPRIERCRIAHFSGDGIRLSHIWCFTIRHCMIAYNKENGLTLRGCDGFILDNWFSANGKAGFSACESTAAMTLTANRIEGNQEEGIIIRGGSCYTINDNYFDFNGGPGLSILPRDNKPSNTFSIIGNLFQSNGARQTRFNTHHKFDRYFPNDTTPAHRDVFENSHARLEKVHGMVFSGNTLRKGYYKLDEKAPLYAIVYGGLKNSIIKDNVMNNGALEQLIVDLGNNEDNVVVKDNVGSVPASLKKASTGADREKKKD